MSFCGTEECAEQIKEATGAKIRGTSLEEKFEVADSCAWCGKQAKEVVYVARAY